jgi:hypothetical protein
MPSFSRPSIPIKHLHPESIRSPSKKSHIESEKEIEPTLFKARPLPNMSSPSIPIKARDPARILSLRPSPPEKRTFSSEERNVATKLFTARSAPLWSSPRMPVKNRDPTKLRSPDTEDKKEHPQENLFKARPMPNFNRPFSPKLRDPTGTSPPKSSKQALRERVADENVVKYAQQRRKIAREDESPVAGGLGMFCGVPTTIEIATSLFHSGEDPDTPGGVSADVAVNVESKHSPIKLRRGQLKEQGQRQEMLKKDASGIRAERETFRKSAEERDAALRDATQNWLQETTADARGMHPSSPQATHADERQRGVSEEFRRLEAAQKAQQEAEERARWEETIRMANELESAANEELSFGTRGRKTVEGSVNGGSEKGGCMVGSEPLDAVLSFWNK